MTLQAVIDEGLQANMTLEEIRKGVERQVLTAALNRCQGNQCKAARLLHIHRNTFVRKANILGINYKDIRRKYGRRPAKG